MNWLLLLLAADAAVASFGFSAVAGGMWGYRAVAGWRSRKGRRRAPYRNPPIALPLAGGALATRPVDRPWVYSTGRCAADGGPPPARHPGHVDARSDVSPTLHWPDGILPPALPLTSLQRRPGSRV